MATRSKILRIQITAANPETLGALVHTCGTRVPALAGKPSIMIAAAALGISTRAEEDDDGTPARRLR